MNSVFRRIPIIARTSQAAKLSATTAANDGTFRHKTVKEAWMSDKGAYPVMATIALGLVFTSSVTIWATTTNNDARWTDRTRKSLFRGEYAQEYQHPVKPSHH